MKESDILLPENKFKNINYLELIKKDLEIRDYKIIVLDDDPTGVQTVNNVFFITDWSLQSFENIFNAKSHLCYILTNSRSMTPRQSGKIYKTIAANLCRIAKFKKKYFILISRSDSTLRGHYPLEIKVLKQVLEDKCKTNFTHEILIPAFFEGGRLTFDNIHWVRDGDMLIPCSETEYAQDPDFGYKNSNLIKWVQEKSGYKIEDSKIVSISINDIREKGHVGVKNKLLENKNKIVIVNALNYNDLEIFTYGCILAEREGIMPIFRTASSFVKIRGAIEDRNLLKGNEIFVDSKNMENKRGLIIVGSYIKRSTEQLYFFLNDNKNTIYSLEINIDQLFKNKQAYLKELTKSILDNLKKYNTFIIYTSREQKKYGNYNGFQLSNIISDYLVKIIKIIFYSREANFNYLISKGGITSSDIATKVLGIKKALVMGQIYPGIPVLKIKIPEKLDGFPLIIFPGNVGQNNSLSEVYKKLKNQY